MFTVFLKENIEFLNLKFYKNLIPLYLKGRDRDRLGEEEEKRRKEKKEKRGRDFLFSGSLIPCHHHPHPPALSLEARKESFLRKKKKKPCLGNQLQKVANKLISTEGLIPDL